MPLQITFYGFALVIVLNREYLFKSIFFLNQLSMLKIKMIQPQIITLYNKIPKYFCYLVLNCTMTNQQGKLFIGIPRLLQKINLQTQLPHECLIFTGPSQQHQNYQYLLSIYRSIVEGKFTHHISKCQDRLQMSTQLTKFVNRLKQVQYKVNSDYCQGHLLICASVDYQKYIRSTVKQRMEKIKMKIQINYLFVTRHKVSRLQTLLAELGDQHKLGKAKQEVFDSNFVRYTLQEQGKKQEILYLNWNCWLFNILGYIPTILRNIIRDQYQSMKGSKSKPCIFTTSSIKTSSHLQNLYTYLNDLTLLNCQSQNPQSQRTSYQRLFYLLDYLNFKIEKQVQLEQQRKCMKNILAKQDTQELLQNIMSCTGQPKALSYLDYVFLYAYPTKPSQSEEEEQITIYTEIPKQHSLKLNLQTNRSIVSKSIIFAKSSDAVSPGNILICITARPGKYCYRLQPQDLSQQSQIHVLWPMCEFEVQEITSEWIRLKYKDNVLTSQDIDHLNKGYTLKYKKAWTQYEDWTQINSYLPCITLSNKYSSSSHLYETNRKYYMNLTATQKKRCNQLLLSLCSYLEQSQKYEQALNYSKMHLKMLREICFEQYLSQCRTNSQRGSSAKYDYRFQIYYEVCINVAHLQLSSGFIHESLTIIQDCLMQLPIYYYFESTLKRIAAELMTERQQIEEMDMISLKLMAHYCFLFAKLNSFDMAKQLSKHLKQTLTPIPTKKQIKKQLQNLEQQINRLSTQIKILEYKHKQRQDINNETVNIQKVLKQHEIQIQNINQLQLMKLAQIHLSSQKVESALQIVEKCINCINQNVVMSRKFRMECLMIRVRCLYKLGRKQECIQGCQDLIQGICEIVSNCVDGVDTQQTIEQDYNTLIKQAHILYYKTLQKQGKLTQAMQIYHQYVTYYASEHETGLYQQFTKSQMI